MGLVPLTIGILGLQGDFKEHAKIIQTIANSSVTVLFLKTELDFKMEIDGIIIPGGESTVLRILAKKHGLWSHLQAWVRQSKPVWGTCAGIILLASGLENKSNEHVEEGPMHSQQIDDTQLQGLSIKMARNAYGSQIFSFSQILKSSIIPGTKGVFIRAPSITTIFSPDVIVLATINNSQVVAVREGYSLGTCFHPELTNDPRWHEYFLQMVSEYKQAHKKLQGIANESSTITSQRE